MREARTGVRRLLRPVQKNRILAVQRAPSPDADVVERARCRILHPFDKFRQAKRSGLADQFERQLFEAVRQPRRGGPSSGFRHRLREPGRVQRCRLVSPAFMAAFVAILPRPSGEVRRRQSSGVALDGLAHRGRLLLELLAPLRPALHEAARNADDAREFHALAVLSTNPKFRHM